MHVTGKNAEYGKTDVKKVIVTAQTFLEDGTVRTDVFECDAVVGFFKDYTHDGKKDDLAFIALGKKGQVGALVAKVPEMLIESMEDIVDLIQEKCDCGRCSS